MFKIRKPIIRVPVRFGVIGGILYIVLFLVLYFLDQDPLLNGWIPGLLLLALFLFFSIKEFKTYHNQKMLHYWQGMTVGFINYLLIGVISFSFILIFTTVIKPEALEENIQNRKEILLNNEENYIENIGQEGFDQMFAEMENITALGLAFGDLLLKIIIGLFLTIIFSLILRKH